MKTNHPLSFVPTSNIVTSFGHISSFLPFHFHLICLWLSFKGI